MPDAAAADALPPLAGLGEMIVPARTALIVVDIQVDFAARDGVIGRHGADMSACETAIDRIEAMIAAARAAGVAIGFMRVMTRPETDSDALRTWMARRGTPEGGAICRVGSGGEAYYRVRPQPGDIEIEKLVYSSFHGTDLDGILRARGIDTLVIAGISTDCCVDSTARDAFHRNYHVFVAADACAAFDDALHDASLKALELHCALLTTARDVVAAWSGAPA